MPNDLLFEIKNLNKVFDDGTIALKDVDLTIKKNKVTVIIGPSGSGKSTLLRTLNLMEIPTSGKIKIHGNDVLSSDFDIHNHRKLVGMVFQNFNLFSHLSIIDNLNLAQIQVLKRNKLDATNRSLALLDKVGLLSKKDNHPNQLSGGQQQRIAILRALLMDPEVILFDEPTSALDPEMIKEVLLLMKDLMTTGITMVIVTHEMNFARAFADQMVVMGKGGKIIETGTPKMIFEQAKHDKTKQFLSNVLNSF